MSADKQIAEILATYDEPMAGNVWRVQGTAVIYHKALERIAAKARIAFDRPQIIRAERDEAVIMVVGRIGDAREEWSIGEALINVNYRVSGKQAAYVYAMAEKRAKDRVILKLVGLHGFLYSEEEADEFKDASPVAQERRRQARPGQNDNRGSQTRTDPLETTPEDEIPADLELKAQIDLAQTINAVTDLMLLPKTQARLAAMPAGFRDEVREHARSRLVSLGWPGKRRRPEPTANEAAEAADTAAKLEAALQALEGALERAETDDEVTAAHDAFREATPAGGAHATATRVRKLLADARARIAQPREAAE